MNEGHLGKFGFGGERAATDDHPAVIHHLPLDESVNAPLAVGTLLARVTGNEGAVTYKGVTKAGSESPCAVVDKPCDPTGEKGEKSVCAVVHGTVKTRLLTTIDNQPPTAAQFAALADHGVYAV